MIDLAPTVFDAVGVEAPEVLNGVTQQPIEGESMRYTFAPAAVDAAAHPTTKSSQYFEMRGHRAIWSRGWKAVTYHRPDTTLEDDVWELYHLDADFSECRDLAAEEPEKLAEMIELFWADAERYGVLPIDERGRFGAAFAGRPIPGTPRARDAFIYFPPVDRIPADSAPPLGGRSWQLRADVDRPTDRSSGVILAYGTVNNGLSVYLDDGHLVYEHNFFQNRTTIRSPEQVPVGVVRLGVELGRVRRGPAAVRLLIDDVVVAEGVVPELSIMISSVGLDIGRGLAGVSDAYTPPADFEGTLSRVSIDTVRAVSAYDERAAEIRVALGTQ